MENNQEEATPPVEFYSPGQLKVVLPHLEGMPRPQWFLLGGPADANEAQTAVEFWPGVKVLGVELNQAAIDFQRKNGWPENCPLLQAALWKSSDMVSFFDPGLTLRHGNVDFEGVAGLAETQTTTWDELDALYGPFQDAVMWMDIEGSEYEALQGAEKLFERRAVLLVDIELLERPGPRSVVPALAHEFMLSHGFKHVKDWNASEKCRDRIYVRKPL